MKAPQGIQYIGGVSILSFSTARNWKEFSYQPTFYLFITCAGGKKLNYNLKFESHTAQQHGFP